MCFERFLEQMTPGEGGGGGEVFWDVGKTGLIDKSFSSGEISTWIGPF